MDRSGTASVPQPNIGPRGCRRRGTMGWVWLALGVGLMGFLGMRAAPVGWYALTVFPFFLAALGYFQAQAQTCVFFAAVGQRDMDGGAERITDAAELSRVRVVARGVWVRALLTALALTVLAMGVAAIVAV